MTTSILFGSQHIRHNSLKSKQDTFGITGENDGLRAKLEHIHLDSDLARRSSDPRSICQGPTQIWDGNLRATDLFSFVRSASL